MKHSNKQTNKQTKAVIIRMPRELFKLVEKSAQEHGRSNTQELIVIIKNGLATTLAPMREPHRLTLGRKILKKDLLDAINEGRESLV